jgi:hypothetical protein
MRPDLGVLLADAAALGAALDVLHNCANAQMFLMDDGVRAATDPRLRALVAAGGDVTLCAMDAESRGVVALPPDGLRFGSQWDHACMIRDAREVVAFTGARATRSRPETATVTVTETGTARAGRRVRVEITRAAKAHQALRSAVGYTAAQLDVTVAVEDDLLAAMTRADHETRGPILRALGTLRALGCAIGPTRAPADVEVIW